MTEQERAKLEELERKVETCQNDVKSDIEQLKTQHRELSAELKEQAIARKVFNGDMNSKIDAMSAKIEEYTNEEMNTVKNILKTLEDLVLTTKENTDAIKDIAETTESNTNFIEYVRRKWMMITLIGTGAVGTLSALYMMYAFLEKNGVVFVIEKASS